MSIPRDDLFEDSEVVADLEGRTIRGGTVALAGQAIRFILQLGTTIALARLLTPLDFGLVAMTSAVIGFLSVFKTLGLPKATVQKESITHEQISTLFWINLAMSVGVTGAQMALAPAIAWFYGEPKLVLLTLAISVALFTGEVSIQHQALLRRQMRFGVIILADTVSILIASAVAIWTAFYGWGYWALVFMQLANRLSLTIVILGCCRWIPGRPRRGAGVREMLRFGGYFTGNALLQYLIRNLDSLSLGWLKGGHSLGLYSKAYSFLMLPIRFVSQPIGDVMTPALSRLQQDRERLKQSYLAGLSFIAILSFPIMAGVATAAEEVVLVFLGPKWVEAIPVLRVLAIAGLFQGIYKAAAQVYLASGRSDRMFRAALVLMPVFCIAFFVGVHWGAYGLAVAYTATFVLSLPMYLAYTYRTIDLRLVQAAKAMAPAFLASLFASLVIFLVGLAFVAETSPFLLLGVKTATGAMAYALALRLLCPADLRSATERLKAAFGRKASGNEQD